MLARTHIENWVLEREDESRRTPGLLGWRAELLIPRSQRASFSKGRRAPEERHPRLGFGFARMPTPIHMCVHTHTQRHAVVLRLDSGGLEKEERQEGETGSLQRYGVPALTDAVSESAGPRPPGDP